MTFVLTVLFYSVLYILNGCFVSVNYKCTTSLQLHDGQNITAIIDEGTFYENIGENADALYTLLLIEGYLTAESIQWGPAGQECTLAIPNKEVHILWQEIFRHLS